MSTHLYKTREDLLSFLQVTLLRFFQLTITLLALFFLMRAFEYIFISQIHQLPKNSLSLAVSGIYYDTVFVLIICCYGIIPFFIISYFKPGFAVLTFVIVSILAMLSNLLLIFYYSKSLVPLGVDLFGYSLKEILHTVQVSGAINVFLILTLIFFISIALVGFHFSRKIFLPKYLLYVLFIALLAVVFFCEEVVPKDKEYKTELEFYTVINKLQFLSGKVIPYLSGQEEEFVGGDYFIDDKSEGQNSFFYVDKNYPFMRLDSSQNVLGNFFNTSKELPNFVFIITESLGRSFSGEGAGDGSFTPFLDSLARQSLYWKNFLSTSGRTFAVFSSLFGSLPFGEKGFLDFGEKMPKHFSFVTYLKQLGYRTSFFHGGDVHFDNMDVYFKKQDIDFILGDKNFGSGFKKMPAKSEGFSWGYGDKELFQRSMQILTSEKNVPRLDIYLTLSMHDPFLVEGQELYKNKVRQQLQSFPLTVQQKAEYEKYFDMYATVMYTDDAIKEFFAAYSKRADFQNTIFIITGDHRMPEIPLTTKLDRFHVPFLIYSPLLKRRETIASVSTHFDVLPSLVAFLRENYKIETPKYVSWLGSGLDTASYFRNTHSLPLMRNKNELLDYLDQNYLLADKKVFEVFDNLVTSKLNDDVVQNKLQNNFNEFKSRNKSMIQTKKLLPDSVLQFVAKRKK